VSGVVDVFGMVAMLRMFAVRTLSAMGAWRTLFSLVQLCVSGVVHLCIAGVVHAVLHHFVGQGLIPFISRMPFSSGLDSLF
jgi:hypothetical protein